MSYIEAPTETITRFIHSWKNTNRDRLREEIVSAFNETHRKPDEYRYKSVNERLVDYKTGEEIKIDSSTELGQKEAEFLDVLNHWFNENEEGTAVWISPNLEGFYPCNKITTYRIEYLETGEKTTFNVTVLFDTPKDHTIKIASELNPVFSEIEDPEILRNKLISLDEKFDLVSLLKLIGAKQYFPETPSQTNINYFIDQIYSGRDPREIAMEMEKRGVIGEFSVSCGGGIKSNSLNGNSLSLDFRGGMEDQYGPLDFECPHCNQINTRPFGQLLSNCQYCGGNVRC